MVRVTRTTKTSSRCSLPQIIFLVLLSGLSFYIGVLSGMGFSDCDDVSNLKDPKGAMKKSDPTSKADSYAMDAKIESIVKQRVEAELSKGGGGKVKDGHHNANKSSSDGAPRFENTMHSYAQGMVRIKKKDFTSIYDFGTPVTKSTGTGEEDAILIYNSPKALPSDKTAAHRAVHHYQPDEKEHMDQKEKKKGKKQEDEVSDILLMDVNEATENCDSLNVITAANPGNTQQCTVIVANYENYHVQRWMKIPPNGGELDSNVPLRPVSRGMKKTGNTQFKVPKDEDVQKHWESLRTYFESVDDVIKELTPIAKRVAKDNTIIVMTCNMGQSELLMNFVCNARSRGLDISNILVFPTDQETQDLAEGLGLATYFDKMNLGTLPKGEARHYADKTFVAMMFAKVVCVQLISKLGYDLLFQDVDIVWYRNPLEYFHDSSNPYRDFDMYFQDDGAHTTRFAPTSANSGFYYVRNNPMTRYFFNSLLYSSDLIIRAHSHQQAMVQIMAEHSNVFGLRVKVLDRTMEEFPGGFHYHSRRNYGFMKKFLKGETNTEMFHMSWTNNKANKIKFFQQMGEWYLEEKCIGKEKNVILGNAGDGDGDDSSLIEPCCLAEAEITCHYRDKPSKIPCKDSDPIDKGAKSFW